MQLKGVQPAQGNGLRSRRAAIKAKVLGCSAGTLSAWQQQAMSQQICSISHTRNSFQMPAARKGWCTRPGHLVCLATPSPDPSPEADKAARDRERSALVNEETLYFIFQLDLDTQLQRALNYEAYEQAQEVRAKRLKVDEALEAMRQRKAENLGGGGSGAEGPGGTLSMADLAAEGLRLRTAMARAVEAEDYKEAASLRDTLAALEVKTRQTESLAAALKGGAAFRPTFRLGQRIWHTQLGYRGVVVGWDAQCCETQEWQDNSGAVALSTNQPFYHVLVDQRDWGHDAYQPPMAYVAQELMWAPEQGGSLPEQAVAVARKVRAEQDEAAGVKTGSADVASVPAGTSWAEVFSMDPLDHPFMYILFLGQDAAGDYLPCRQLRSKYNMARRDVYKPGEGNADN